MKRARCRRVEPLLALAAGADLSSSLAAVVEEHLRTCGDCRRAAQDFAATVHTIRDLPALRVSPEETAGLRRGVWSRIEKDRATSGVPLPGNRGTALRAAGWAAAGLVVLVLLLPWRPPAEPPATSRASISPRRARPGIPAAAEPAPALARPAAKTTPRIAQRGAPRARAIAQSNEPVRIELSTPDPDVRIVWLVGSPREDLPPLQDDGATATATIKEDPQ